MIHCVNRLSKQHAAFVAVGRIAPCGKHASIMHIE